MEYFQAEHPKTETFICDYAGCNQVADYLEINEQGHEYLACETHKTADRHASRLPKRAPNPALPHRTQRPA
jgi:hypothetical protein